MVDHNQADDVEHARDVLMSAGRENPAEVDILSVISAGLSLSREVGRLSRELECQCASRRNDAASNPPGAPVAGHQLLEDRDRGGPRHFLAERAVHAGDVVYLLTQLGWMPARYEWGYRPGTQCQLYVRLPGADNATAVQMPHGARLAWPDEINGG